MWVIGEICCSPDYTASVLVLYDVPPVFCLATTVGSQERIPYNDIAPCFLAYIAKRVLNDRRVIVFQSPILVHKEDAGSVHVVDKMAEVVSSRAALALEKGYSVACSGDARSVCARLSGQ